MKIVHYGRETEVKSCIISLAIEFRKYQLSLIRLQESLKRVNFKKDFIYWNEYPPGAPTQLDAPFAFKVFCFMEAKRLGYEKILWMDASCVAIRPLDSIFRIIEQDGYVIFKNSSNILGEWCSDEVLSICNLTREEALKIPEVEGSIIGLNLCNAQGSEFLSKWYQKAIDGVSFRGVPEKNIDWNDYENVKWNRNGRVSKDPRVHGHRHDQTLAGLIANQLKMNLLKEGYSGISTNYKTTLVILVREPDVKIQSLNRIYFRVFVVNPILDLIRKLLKSILSYVGKK